MSHISTEKIELAAQFVNSTSSHIFLTGKAGTGKTTFLRDIAEATHKNFVIVAPTGVAALNAQGVTIHSQFLFPFGTFLQEETHFDQAPQGNFFTRNQLARKHPLNSARKQVLRNIDLLIIDEVSMVRADLLDAIDYRMKSVKGNFKQAFGGVQLLMIGDLFQLQPIVKDHEWKQLKDTYKSPHFYESISLKKNGFTYIELDKIFRQQDEQFIRILNNIRNNVCTKEDLDILNAHVQPNNEPTDAITLTTHNHLADRLNQQELAKLGGKSHFYEAEIEGDFPERIYPLSPRLELKSGAKVMFIKNDTEEKQYYNGKMAEVCELSSQGICVKMDNNDKFWVRKHLWENLKYKLNATTKEIEEEVIGSYFQYPLKPAWAITVHKSQGLTFESAVLDVGKAFASGQVYVALSRLRSLKGLILRTPISASVISNDAEVVRFSKNKAQQSGLQETLKASQSFFLKNLLLGTFNFSEIPKQVEYTEHKTATKMEFEDPEMRIALQNLKESFLKQQPTTSKFQKQISQLLQEKAYSKLLERIQKGSIYYLNFLEEQLLQLLIHLGEVRQLSKTKTYQTALLEIDQLIAKKIEQAHKATYVSQCILEGKKIEKNDELRHLRIEKRASLLEKVEIHLKENPKNLKNKTGRTQKKDTKGETYQITFSLLKEGLNLEEIAKKRNLVVGTIESHLARGIGSGEVEIDQFVDEKELETLRAYFEDGKVSGLSDIYKETNGKYSYGKLRMVQASLKRKV